jgi:WD40 repeat protein/mono/diheme cytochrome c family protein
MPRLIWVGLAVIASTIAGAAPVESTQQAMALIADHCYACHNPEKQKGGLTFSTRQRALEGGDDGAVLVPGKPGESTMLAALEAEADPHMPPKKQLTAREIATVREWIAAGAEWDEGLLSARVKRIAVTRPVTLRELPGSYQPVMALAISADQRRLAAGRGDRILIFDLSQKGRPMIAQLVTAHDVVQSLAWSEDGKWLASGGFRSVRLWDPRSREPIRTFDGFAGRVTALAFAPDGKTLFAGEGEPAFPGIVRSWQIPDGKPAQTWTAHADAVLAMKIGDGGKILVTAGGDKLVKTWDPATGKELAKFEGHTAQVMAVALSRDGKQLASAGADKEIKIWDAKTREQTAALLTNPDGVTDLAWVDDKALLSACEDGIARVSSAANKDRAEKNFMGAPDVLYCAAIARDGTVYAGCHDGFVYVWSSSTAKLEGKLPISDPATQPAAGR